MSKRDELAEKVFLAYCGSPSDNLCRASEGVLSQWAYAAADAFLARAELENKRLAEKDK